MNKRHIYIIIGLFLLLCCPLHSWSISIIYEYWIDNNRTTTSSGETDDGAVQNLQIDVGDLSPGVHFYNVRTKYGNTGQWGTVYRTLFAIPYQAVSEEATLQQYEYWLDNDYANRVTAACTDGDKPLLALDAGNLTAGVHFFNVRAQHADGTWGTVDRTQFTIPTAGGESVDFSLQQYEYWIDNDYEGRVIAAYTEGEQTPDLNIDVSSLSPGVHFYNVRAQDVNGVWGDVERKLFTIPYPVEEPADKSITGYCYTFQSDDYAFSTVSKSVPATDELVLNENITVALPETAPTVDDNCKFTFNTNYNMATMSRSVDLRFWIGFHAADGIMGMPTFFNDISYTTEETKEWIEMEVGEPSDYFAPQDEEAWGVVQFSIVEGMTYKISADTPCSLRIYKSDGTLFGQSEGEALTNGWRCKLTAGTYYAIVFGNDDEVSLLIEEYHIPVISFADENLEYLIFTQTNWDKNGDDKLDEEEAEQVTNLGELFKEKTSITSFNELAFFTGLTSISENAFLGCSSLKTVTLPANVKFIGSGAFRYCSALTSIAIPASVTEIADDAFIACSALTALTVAADNKVFDSRGNCNAIIASKSNTLLVGCQNTLIPKDVVAIATNAFYGCTGLTEMTIPAGVTNIGNRAFYNCNNLTTVDVKNENPPALLSNSIPKNIRQQATLYVPEGCIDMYTGTNYWKDFKNILEYVEYLKGDLNNDGTISITDVVLIIDVIAGNITDTKMKDAADVNNDGKVSITDCVAAIDQMAAQEVNDPATNSDPAQAPAMTVGASSTGDWISGTVQDHTLTVSLDNENCYTAFQMTVSLPEGMTLGKGKMDKARGKGHQLMVRDMGNGQYLIVGFSMYKDELVGHNGQLFSVAITGQTNGDIVISNVEFATTNAEACHLPDVIFSSTLTDISETRTTDVIDHENVYDLQGRKLAKGTLKKGFYIVNGKKVNIK